MKQNLLTLLAGLAALFAGTARAQWLTQTLELKAGWNAVFLHVDASHATLDQLVGSGAPVPTPIEEVWRWTPNPAAAQFVSSPQQPVDSGSQWASWKRSDGGASTLSRVSGNIACLVYSTANYTWQLKGRPVLPAYEWSTSGLNFFGFPTVPATPPGFEDFLLPVPALLTGEIFRYAGGEFGPNNPGRLFALRTTPVRRGEAYWLRADEIYNRYYGPFEVTAAANGEAAFGSVLGSFSFRIRNLTAAPLTVTLRLAASETPPVGETPIVGTPPLLVRGALNATNLTYGVSDLPVGAPQSWTLAAKGQPGSEAEIVLGLDRAAITANPGELLAGILQLTDSLGQTRVDLPVSAEAGSQAGLWLGAAAVTQVGQYLQSYLRDPNGQLVVETNGAYVVTGVVTNLTAVPSAYPLRLIVHSPGTGPATLWQRLYTGFNSATNPVVANQESALSAALLAQSRRVSATHLPWSEANPGWTFSGPLARGGVLKTTITNAFNEHASNPFLHTYHPDHDNLNPRFSAEVPQGAESYTLVREITLSVQSPPTDFNSRVNAGTTLVGEYLETVRVLGLARAGNTSDTRRFDVRGAFHLTRISDLPTLTRVP